MFVEHYYISLNKDLEKIGELLEQDMPTELRQSLTAEQVKLQDLYRVLSGEESKGELYNLRARLRWARARRDEAKDPGAKRKATDEVSQLEQAIAGLVAKAKKKG